MGEPANPRKGTKAHYGEGNLRKPWRKWVIAGALVGLAALVLVAAILINR